MMRALCFFLCSVSSLALAPGQIFNLTSWKLQLPVADANGKVVEVLQPELATYNSSWFFTDQNSAVFFAPENGAHTSGSSFPRSELRENVDFLIDSKDTQTHTLNATVRVITDGTAKKVTIGQLHGAGLQGHCSIIVELEWMDGEIVSHVRDRKCNNINQVVGKGYALGDAVSYSIVSRGNTVTVSTDTGAAEPYSYSWLDGTNYPAYFKCGNYLQSSGPSSTVGGTVQLDALFTSHQ
jgi:hypothetical protein